jgi:hypothetical protein
MNERDQMHRLIIDSLEASVREFLEWFQIEYPKEHLYAILIDVPSEGDGANILAASEERLNRAAQEVAKPGESLEEIRDAIRWSAPGESGDPWIWPEHQWNKATTHLILLGIDRGLIPRYDTTVKDLAIQALAELNREETFGTGAIREAIYVGVFDIHDDFENWVEWSAECNPESVTVRVREEVIKGNESE